MRSTLVQPIHFVDVAGKDLAAQRDKSKLADENVEAAAVATMNSNPLALSPNYLEYGWRCKCKKQVNSFAYEIWTSFYFKKKLIHMAHNISKAIFRAYVLLVIILSAPSAVASEENFSLTLATNCIFEDNWISMASLMWWMPDFNIFFLDQRSFTNWWTNVTDFGIRFALLHLLELQELEHWNFSFDILKLLMKYIMLKNSELPGSLREKNPPVTTMKQGHRRKLSG